MSEPNEIDELRRELDDAGRAMRLMYADVGRLIAEKLNLAEELVNLRDILATLATSMDTYTAPNHIHARNSTDDAMCPACWANNIRNVLKGDDDV